MPKVKVQAQSKHSPEEAFKKIKGLLETDHDLRKMDPSYQCTFSQSGLNGSAKGSKFAAEMRVTPQGGGSHVEIEVELPLMLSPVKGIVQSTLQKKIDSVLA